MTNGMTVKELIEALQKYPPEHEIMLIDECEGTYMYTELKVGNYHPYYSEKQQYYKSTEIWEDMVYIGNDKRIEQR